MSKSLQLDPITLSERISRNITDITSINIDYTSAFGDINGLHTNPHNGGFIKDDLQTVLVFLQEMENEALHAKDEDYFNNNTAYKLLSKLKKIEEDLVANSRVPTEEWYATYLQKLLKTVDILVNKEAECAEKAIVWSRPWLRSKTAKLCQYALHN